MSQNPQKNQPLETITIKDYLENMLQEENISLKILSKSSFLKKTLNSFIIFIKMNQKHAHMPKVR